MFDHMESLRNRPALARTMWALLALFILGLDFATGEDIQFPIFFLIPIAMAAYYEGLAAGGVMAVLLPLARWGFHFIWEEEGPSLEAAVNSFLLAVVLGLFVYLVHVNARQAIELRKRVKSLEGLVPICAGCKKIRNESGAYEPLEKFISEHSNAEFSHGMCPECITKWYPELNGVPPRETTHT